MAGGQQVELQVDSIGGVLNVAVHGELVAGATGSLRDCLQQASRGRRPVVLELTATTALDDAGLEVIMEAHRGLATRLRLVCERGAPVHQALRRAGVAHVLSVHGSRAAALTAAAPR